MKRDYMSSESEGECGGIRRTHRIEWESAELSTIKSKLDTEARSNASPAQRKLWQPRKEYSGTYSRVPCPEDAPAWAVGVNTPHNATKTY